jgi:hypothetical protein
MAHQAAEDLTHWTNWTSVAAYYAAAFFVNMDYAHSPANL